MARKAGDSWPNKEELAWSAGFFDGEGNIRTGQAGRGVVLSVGQTEPTTLERFKEAVGGLGEVRGPYQGRPIHQPFYVYQATSFEVSQAVVAMLWPWLSQPKRAQARAALLGFRGKPRKRVGRYHFNG